MDDCTRATSQAVRSLQMTNSVRTPAARGLPRPGIKDGAAVRVGGPNRRPLLRGLGWFRLADWTVVAIRVQATGERPVNLMLRPCRPAITGPPCETFGHVAPGALPSIRAYEASTDQLPFLVEGTHRYEAARSWTVDRHEPGCRKRSDAGRRVLSSGRSRNGGVISDTTLIR